MKETRSKLRYSQIKVGPEIVITNESTSYIVSKDFVCSKNPRFKDLYNDYQRAITVVSDNLDLRAIIGWLYSDFIVINPTNAFSLHELACNLNFDLIKNNCISFFNNKFTVEIIPVVMKRIKNDPSLVNLSNLLNTFICRNFLRIIKGQYFLELPFVVVKYIMSLDLLIESEYQVFQGILKWVKHDESNRTVHLSELIKCLRWCYMEDDTGEKIEEDEIVLNLPQFNELPCGPYECTNYCVSDRVKAKRLICIYFNDKSIGICYRAGENSWIPCGTFEEDDKIPVGFLSPEYMLDIIFDSGRSGVRIDFLENKYRPLEMVGSTDSYYSKFYQCFNPKSEIQRFVLSYLFVVFK